MFLATASVKRPVAMGCLIIALIILGVNSYNKISLENMPSVDIPYVTISTTWLGATPEDMEKDVAKYIEDAVSSVEGLKHVMSTCMENVCYVAIEFELSVDVDIAAQNVREKVDTILQDLPADADRPVIEKVDINAIAVATMFLGGAQSVDDLYDYADNDLSDKFSAIQGVASVDLIGGNEREVWVELDRDKVASAGLTSADVVQALQTGILTMPSGRIREAGSEYTLRFDAEYEEIETIGDLEIVTSDGARRYLRDLGTVRNATEEIRQRAFMNGVPGIIIKVVKKSDGNTVEVVNEIKKRYHELQGELPAGMDLTWVFDDGEIVQSTVDSTTNDIISAVLLCAGILFAFLINLRTTLIVSITMPVTIIISLYFMQLAGQTLNTSTMLAIGLSTGILVSNSIVVLENVVRRFTDTPNKWDAAGIGTSQVAVAVLASAGTNVIVMLPIAMMSSMVGRFFTPFALTTLIVNAASIFISFTLTPILCALIMRRADEKNKNMLARFGRRWDEKFEAFTHVYGGWIRWIGDRRLLSSIVLIASVALFFGTMKFGGRDLAFTFMESDDWGRAFVRLEYPSYYDLARTTAQTEAMVEKLKDYPDLDFIIMSSGKADAMGGQASEGVYLAQIEMIFKSVNERDWKLDHMLERIREDLAPFTDVIVTVSRASMFGGGSSNLEYDLTGPDLDEIGRRAKALQLELYKSPNIADIDTTARDDKPEIKVTPNRAVMSDIGLTASSLGTILRANTEGIQAASYKSGDRTIDIRVKFLEEEGRGQVERFSIPGFEGYPVPLASVANVENTSSKIMVYRVDKERTVKVAGNERPGVAMGTVMNDVLEAANRIGVTEGAGYKLRDAGMGEIMTESVADFAEALLLAVILTYLTLSAILESFVRPFIILLTIPMALIGIVLALNIANMNISIFVLLGCILLIGVVVNSAILIVDRMGQLIAEGECRREAMYKGLEETFRSVLMVICASGLGMVPIAMATGIGSANRIGIGAASVGGIIVAGLLTITVLPLMYVFFTKTTKH